MGDNGIAIAPNSVRLPGNPIVMAHNPVHRGPNLSCAVAMELGAIATAFAPGQMPYCLGNINLWSSR